MSARNKISPDQIMRATRCKADLTGGAVVLAHFVENDETTIAQWEYEETREVGTTPLKEWMEDVVESVARHADSCGNGQHRYSLRTYDASGKERVATWFRWVVRESREGINPSDELDGSTGAFMMHLQRAFEEERKARHDALRMVETTQHGILKLLGAMTERQTQLEEEHRATRDEERRQLDEALKLLEEGQKKPEGGGLLDGEAGALASIVIDRVLERYGEHLEPLVLEFAKSMSTKAEVAEVAEVASEAAKVLPS